MMHWQLDTNTLMCSDLNDLGWWNHVPRPLPEDVWAALGLQRWDHGRLRWWTEAQMGFVRFAWLVGHVASLKDMPDPNAVGERLLAGYVQEQEQSISKALQSFVDAVTKILDYILELPEGDLNNRPALVKVGQQIQQVFDTLRELDLLNSKRRLYIKELGGLEDRLQQLLYELEVTRLYWAEDVLQIG